MKEQTKVLIGVGSILVIGILLLVFGGAKNQLGGLGTPITNSSSSVSNTASICILANSARTRLDVVNDGLVGVYLVKSATTTGIVAGIGPDLYPNGGAYFLDNTNGKSPYFGPFACITRTGTSSITYTEE